jgi:hypothetical protein
VAGLLQRLLTRSGILPVLRSQWRADQAAASERLEKRLEKRLDNDLADLNRDVARLSSELSERLRQLEPLLNSATERVERLEREVRVMYETMGADVTHRRRGVDYAPLFSAPGMSAHVEDAIRRAPIHTDPSVHIVIDGLLPSQTYEALVDGIPRPVFFSQKDDTKQNLRLSNIHIAPESTIQMLTFLEEALIPRLMVPALLQKLTPHIREFYTREYGAERGQALAAIPHEATRGRLMLRRPGYHLDPHLDPKRVVFTCLLYFARPGDSEAFGTTFYRMDGTPNIDRTNTFYPQAQGIRCDPVKMVPFRPNTAVAFLNWGGAHGADIPKDAPKDTERYSYQFYVSPEPAALAALSDKPESALAK